MVLNPDKSKNDLNHQTTVEHQETLATEGSGLSVLIVSTHPACALPAGANLLQGSALLTHQPGDFSKGVKEFFRIVVRSYWTEGVPIAIGQHQASSDI